MSWLVPARAQLIQRHPALRQLRKPSHRWRAARKHLPLETSPPSVDQHPVVQTDRPKPLKLPGSMYRLATPRPRPTTRPRTPTASIPSLLAVPTGQRNRRPTPLAVKHSPPRRHPRLLRHVRFPITAAMAKVPTRSPASDCQQPPQVSEIQLWRIRRLSRAATTRLRPMRHRQRHQLPPRLLAERSLAVGSHCPLAFPRPQLLRSRLPLRHLTQRPDRQHRLGCRVLKRPTPPERSTRPPTPQAASRPAQQADHRPVRKATTSLAAPVKAVLTQEIILKPRQRQARSTAKSVRQKDVSTVERPNERALRVAASLFFDSRRPISGCSRFQCLKPRQRHLRRSPENPGRDPERKLG